MWVGCSYYYIKWSVMLPCTCLPLRTWIYNSLFCQTSCWSQSLYSLLIFNYGIAFHLAMFAIRTDVDQIIQYLHSIHWIENLLLRGISWLCILRFFDHQQNQPYCWQWYFCWHNVKAICTYTDLPLNWYIYKWLQLFCHMNVSYEKGMFSKTGPQISCAKRFAGIRIFVH